MKENITVHTALIVVLFNFLLFYSILFCPASQDSVATWHLLNSFFYQVQVHLEQDGAREAGINRVETSMITDTHI